jgi:glycine cleavage system aminomethyltransferase T
LTQRTPGRNRPCSEDFGNGFGGRSLKPFAAVGYLDNRLVAIAELRGSSLCHTLARSTHFRFGSVTADRVRHHLGDKTVFGITPSARLRPSPFFEATLAEGVCAFTTYNHMLMPTSYGRPEEEYWRLINGVSQWDVAVERQVQLKGPDAGKLAQILAPRDLSACAVGQGKYVPLCDHYGVLINDPIVLKLAHDLYWLSIADSNIWFWASAIAAERRLKVEVSEPDVSPMAIQGPKAIDVVAHVCGDWVRAMKYFWFRERDIQGIPTLVARSGWSKQGGFEIYLRDGTQGTALWNIFKEAGAQFGIGPGNPNLCERIESGLISFGGDTDALTNPFEVRMGKYVDLDVPDDTIGIQALRRLSAEGPKRHLLGLVFDAGEPSKPGFSWSTIYRNGRKVGALTNSVFSYRLKKNIGFALIARDCVRGDRVEVQISNTKQPATLTDLPFL